MLLLLCSSKVKLSLKTTNRHTKPMTNTIPQAIDPLFALADEAANGLHALQTVIGITQNTETIVRADLASARTANSAYETSLNVRVMAVADQTGTVADAVDFIHTARDVLKPQLGRRYSQARTQAGVR